MKKGWRIIFLAVISLAIGIAAALGWLLHDRGSRPAIGESRFAAGAAGRIEYHVLGHGRPIILLPSFARGASDFNELARALVHTGYRTLAVEPRGSGGSNLGGFDITLHGLARDVIAVLRAEHIQQPVAIVGHAYGNRVARTVAADDSSDVGLLILLGAGGARPPAPTITKDINVAVFGAGTLQARRAAVRRAFFASKSAVPDYWVDGWLPLTGLLEAKATASTAFTDYSAGGNVPIFVLQGAEDKPAPPINANELVSRSPHRITIQIVSQAGHAMLPEQPETVTAAIIEYLQQHDYRP